jgi:hypothetical protein
MGHAVPPERRAEVDGKLRSALETLLTNPDVIEVVEDARQYLATRR